MKALDRKLLRDLSGMKGQVVAIGLVIAAGVATFVMSLSTLASLTSSRDAYYAGRRFAHVFAHLKRAPNGLARRIEEIPGVAQVQTRIVRDVTLDVEGLSEPAVGRLISTPASGVPLLNGLHLRRGRFLDPVRCGEALVSEAFAEAHGLGPGDRVRAVMNGRYQELEIAGVVLSPEYVLQIRGGDLLPDEKRFGVFWMGRAGLAAAFDMEGAFNDVALTLMRGASEAEVLDRLDALIAPYGGVGAYGRGEQVSHHYLTEEIRGLRTMAVFAPAIFLSVAAFLLNVVVSRLVSTQREQIAALKAFGYTRGEIGRHYLLLVMLITGAGLALGTAAGAWLGRDLTALYVRFYRFPEAAYRLDEVTVLMAIGIGAGAAVIGTLASVRRAVRLPPAEAMRPEPPASFRPTLVERLGLQRMLPHSVRMILRHLERRPLKSLLSCLGIAAAVAVLIVGSFMEDSLDYLVDFQFHRAQREDMSLAFIEPLASDALHEVSRMPGVITSEPFRSLAARIRAGHRQRRVGIMGLPRDSTLYTPLTVEGTPVPIPDDGLVLSAKLAEILHAELGDVVVVEVLEGKRPVREIPVVGLANEYSGTNAYMSFGAAHRLMREGDLLSGAFLSVDALRREELYRDLKTTPGVAGVTVKSASLQSFEETVAENMLQMRLFNIVFACIIAIGVVYNTARISLSERARDLATLRVIGFRRGEISAILLGELAVLTAVAIPLGLALGSFLAWLVTIGVETELFRMPFIISPSTHALAAAVVAVAALVSGLIVRRRLDRLDLVAVLKTRE